jgi:hypothetical protein
MMRNKPLVYSLVCLIVAAVGCKGGDTGDGVKPEDQQVLSDAAAIAQKAPSFDQLSPQDKQTLLKTYGSEQGARAAFGMIKNPPNAGIVQSHSGAPSTAGH